MIEIITLAGKSIATKPSAQTPSAQQTAATVVTSTIVGRSDKPLRPSAIRRLEK